MAKTNHPATRQPLNNENLRLWRYMDFTKYVDLLESKALFLSRVDKFEDTYEGAYPRENLEQQLAMREYYQKQYFNDDPDYLHQRSAEETKRSEWHKQHAYVNCWHASDYESAAMWKLYGQSDNSVAIETDYLTLAKVTSDYIYLGLVTYIDYQTESFPQGNEYYRYFHKRKSFEYEKEVRLFSERIPITVDSEGRKAYYPDVDNELPGVKVGVDLTRLVKRVHVSPTAPEWFRNLVEKTTAQFNFSFEIAQSSLYSDPLK
jgi:hypothetical protein